MSASAIGGSGHFTFSQWVLLTAEKRTTSQFELEETLTYMQSQRNITNIVLYGCCNKKSTSYPSTSGVDLLPECARPGLFRQLGKATPRPNG